MSFEVIEGDCLAMMYEMPDDTFDTCVTSPPYNINHKKETPEGGWKGITRWYDNLPEDKYQDWQSRVLEVIYDKLRPGGSCFYNHKIRNKNNEVIHPLRWIDRTPFTVRQVIVWDYNDTHNHEQTYYYPIYELVFWLTKGIEGVTAHNDRGYSNIWKIPRERNRKWEHNAPFPKELVTRCLSMAGNKGDKVLDPFCGSGTTGEIALRHGMDFVGIELDGDYRNMSIERLEGVVADGYGKQATLWEV